MADAPRNRRWRKWLAALAVLGLAAGLWINHQMEPTRLTALVLARAGAALGLELTIEGTPEYALRPEPRLVLPNLVVRQPGASTPLLHAARAEVSLPWDTLLGGDSLVISRLELQRPVLDLAALAAWQASRPPAPFELPSFTRGLAVTEGTVIGEGWALDRLSLDVGELLPGAPARATVSGQWERQASFVLFEGELSLASAGLASGLETKLAGRLRDGELDVPYQLAFAGDFDATGDDVVLTLASLSLDSESPLPDLTAAGTLRLGTGYEVKLRGSLAEWPVDWPALPAPLSASTAPIAWTADYLGAPDFRAPLSLAFVREQTTLDTRLVASELQAWLEQADASPLPPLQGRLVTPTVEVSGFTLEGVEISLDDEDTPAEADARP